MDKTEEFVKKYLKDRDFDHEEIEYIFARDFIGRVLDIMDEYAQQVSRDIEQKQCDTCITDGSLCPKESIVPCPYWESNQENNHG